VGRTPKGRACLTGQGGEHNLPYAAAINLRFGDLRRCITSTKAQSAGPPKLDQPNKYQTQQALALVREAMRVARLARWVLLCSSFPVTFRCLFARSGFASPICLRRSKLLSLGWALLRAAVRACWQVLVAGCS
jgi:hypothetical protein